MSKSIAEITEVLRAAFGDATTEELLRARRALFADLESEIAKLEAKDAEPRIHDHMTLGELLAWARSILAIQGWDVEGLSNSDVIDIAESIVKLFDGNPCPRCG